MAMLTAVTPYMSWMQAAGGTAGEAAAQATAAATAYETAFAAHVRPWTSPPIAHNWRSWWRPTSSAEHPGHRIHRIHYTEMWVQDALAMDGYAGSSAAATKLTPFSAAPQITNGAGLAAQAAASPRPPAPRPAARSRSFVPDVAPQPGGVAAAGGRQPLHRLHGTLNRFLNYLVPRANLVLDLCCSCTQPCILRSAIPPSTTTSGSSINLPASQFLGSPCAAPLRLERSREKGWGPGLGWTTPAGWWTLFGLLTPEAHFGRGTLVGDLATASPSRPRPHRPSGPCRCRVVGRRTGRSTGGRARRGRTVQFDGPERACRQRHGRRLPRPHEKAGAPVPSTPLERPQRQHLAGRS